MGLAKCALKFLVAISLVFLAGLFVFELRVFKIGVNPKEFLVSSNHLRSDIQVNPYSVSLATHSDHSYFKYINFVVVSWVGDIVVAVSLENLEEYNFESALRGMLLPARVRVIQHRVYDSKYPINELRNIAMNAVLSTHVLVSDIDIVPSVSLSEVILNLPKSYLRNPLNAFIVPLFEFKHEVAPCNNWIVCQPLMKTYNQCTKKKLYNMINFDRSCVDIGSKAGQEYLFPKWYNLAPTNHSTPLDCWSNELMQPFVVVAKSNHLPQFDQRFYGYGMNRVQWLSHLRYLGYSFHVISHSWAFHLNHAKTPSQVRYESTPSNSLYGVDATKAINLYKISLEPIIANATAHKRQVIPLCNELKSISNPLSTGREGWTNQTPGRSSTGRMRLERRTPPPALNVN